MEINKVYCEDALIFLDKLEPESIDLAIIDPPYNLNQGDWDTFDSVDAFMDFSANPKLQTGNEYLYLFLKTLKGSNDKSERILFEKANF